MKLENRQKKEFKRMDANKCAIKVNKKIKQEKKTFRPANFPRGLSH